MPQKGLNKVMLIGNLGRDPELRYTQSNRAILSLNLATNESYKNNDGEWKNQTKWHRVVVWDKRAEELNKILQKGSSIYVEGKLQTREWKDKDDNTRYTTEILAWKIIPLNKRNNDNDSDDRGSFDRGSSYHRGPDHRGPNHRGPSHRGPDHQGPDHRGPDHQGPDHRGSNADHANNNADFGEDDIPF